jgi:hypothetical protein
MVMADIEDFAFSHGYGTSCERLRDMRLTCSALEPSFDRIY